MMWAHRAIFTSLALNYKSLEGKEVIVEGAKDNAWRKNPDFVNYANNTSARWR